MSSVRDSMLSDIMVRTWGTASFRKHGAGHPARQRSRVLAPEFDNHVWILPAGRLPRGWQSAAVVWTNELLYRIMLYAEPDRHQSLISPLMMLTHESTDGR